MIHRRSGPSRKEGAERTVRQRDGALSAWSEGQRIKERKGFKAEARGKEQRCKQGQVCSVLTGQAGGRKEKDQGER